MRPSNLLDPKAEDRRDIVPLIVIGAITVLAVLLEPYDLPQTDKQTDPLAPAAYSGRGVSSSPAPTTQKVPLGKPQPYGAAVGEGLDQAWRTAEISVYHPRYDGRTTASGETYSHTVRWTAAVSTKQLAQAPLGSVWRVRYAGRTVEVRINDTGSYAPARGLIWLDLSGCAWRDLTNGAAPSRHMATARRVR